MSFVGQCVWGIFLLLVGCAKMDSAARATRPEMAGRPAIRYVPGKGISVAEYERLSEDVWISRRAGRAVEAALDRLSQAAEREVLPALLDLFTRDDVRITYAQFTPVKKVPWFRSEAENHDSGRGLRVVHQMEIPFENATRLISSISFWDYDFENRTFKLATDVDAIRIRAEAGPFTPGVGDSQGFVNLSYSVARDERGRVKRIFPSPSLDDTGGVLEKMSICYMAAHCNSCHHAEERNTVADTLDEPLEALPGFTGFVDYLVKSARVSNPKLREIRESLISPRKTFIPEGLVTALENRWERVRAELQ